MPKGFDRIQTRGDTGKGKEREGPKPLDLTRLRSSEVSSTQDTNHALVAAEKVQQKYTNLQSKHEKEYQGLEKEIKQLELSIKTKLANALRQHPRDEDIQNASKTYIKTKREYDNITKKRIAEDASLSSYITEQEGEISKILEITSFSPKKKVQEIQSIAEGIEDKIEKNHQKRLLYTAIYKDYIQPISNTLDSKEASGSST